MRNLLGGKGVGLAEMSSIGIPVPVGFTITTEVCNYYYENEQLAELAHFFSFGPNYLTQTIFGISRDDFSYHDVYRKSGIIDADFFAALDNKGVGFLIENAVKKGKAVQKDLKCGICGEHDSDPKNFQYAEFIGIDYVSSSPFRISIARLAAPQAVVLKKKK